MPHVDSKVTRTKKNHLHSWICMIPLMKEGSWLYVYDQNFKSKMLKIPLGGFLVIRDDVYHGGFCGSDGNVRMQVSLIPKTGIDKFRYLSHVSKKIANEKGFFDPPAVNYNEAVWIFEEDVKKKLKTQREELDARYYNMDSLYSVR